MMNSTMMARMLRTHMVKCCRYASATSPWTTRGAGDVGTKSWRLFFYAGAKKISPWHDIPLKNSQPSNSTVPLLHYVNEMPKGSTAKLEVATDEPNHPIKHDLKDGVLRFIKAGPMPFNYGCLPQTLEDRYSPDPLTGLIGDGDPLDVVELSEEPIGVGHVQPVKILGALPLVDHGKLDWKLIAIQTNHYMSKQLNDLSDVQRIWPGRLPAIKHWFATYKMAEGGDQNTYALDRNLDRDAAHSVVQGTHVVWQRYMTREVDTHRTTPSARVATLARPSQRITLVTAPAMAVSAGKRYC